MRHVPPVVTRTVTPFTPPTTDTIGTDSPGACRRIGPTMTLIDSDGFGATGSVLPHPLSASRAPASTGLTSKQDRIDIPVLSSRTPYPSAAAFVTRRVCWH